MGVEHGNSERSRRAGGSSVPPHTRVTRQQWLDAARATLVAEGVEQVKIAVLAERFAIARSSFYGYFNNRGELLAALLDQWESLNTSCILERAARPAGTIAAATLNVFECWADPALFDVQLEFAVRDWARRDQAVRSRLAVADTRRLDALTKMHRRFGFARDEAVVRARVQYHSQIGMYALGADEPEAVRFRLLPAYVRVFTGQDAAVDDLARFRRFVRGVERT